MSFLFPSATITFDAALRDLAAGSPKARAIAARALGDVSDPVDKRRAVDALIRALDDDRPEVRMEACASLGSLGETSALPFLLKRLDDGAEPVRQNAAIALGTLALPEGFEPLALALREGPADLRFQAATSLAEIDRVRAYEPLVTALGDRDPQVVGAAALSLGAIGDARAITALAPFIDHTDSGARFDVAYALAELGDAKGRDVLVSALTDESRAWDAVEALARIDAREQLRAAVASKKTPPEAQVLAAGAVLRTTPDDDLSRRVLVDALAHRKIHVRGIAIEQLADVGRAWARLPLEKLARSNKGGDLREAIATSLRAITARELAMGQSELTPPLGEL